MTNTDSLKSMLNNFINDKPEEATLDLHNYLTGKMKEVAGIGGTEEPVSVTDDVPADEGGETPPSDPAEA
jgi:hypothetical protein